MAFGVKTGALLAGGAVATALLAAGCSSRGRTTPDPAPAPPVPVPPVEPPLPPLPPPPRFAALPYAVVNRDFQGFGQQFNTHAFDAAGRVSGIAGPNVGALVQKIVSLHAQHVRVFVPQLVVRDVGSIPDPAERAEAQAMVDGFYRTVLLAHESGAVVNLTWPGGLAGSPKQRYLIGKFVDVMQRLRAEGVTDRMFVTIDNEPSNTDVLINPRKRVAYIKGYINAYRLLDAELRARGLRDSIAVVGEDTYRTRRTDFFQHTGLQLQPLVDAWSFHVYWPLGTRGAGVPELQQIQSLVNRYGPGKPVFVNEYGTEGNTSAGSGARLVRAAMEEGWFAVTAARMGVSAATKWEAYYGGLTGAQMRARGFNGNYGDPGRYYSIMGPGTGFHLRPSYYMQRLLGSSVVRGWQSLSLPQPGANVTAAGFRSPDGNQFSAIAVNRDARAGVFQLTGVPASTQLFVTTWNVAGDGTSSATQPLPLDAVDATGTVRVRIPRQGAVAMSTIDPRSEITAFPGLQPRPIGAE